LRGFAYCFLWTLARVDYDAFAGPNRWLKVIFRGAVQ